MIETARLRLRPWRAAEKGAFHDLVNTPAMTEHFGGLTTRAATDRILDNQIASQARDGFSMWAVETRADGTLAGICGLRRDASYADTPVAGELEIGWRIAEHLWGQGIAREAAEASIAWGWANTPHPRISAWTTAGNARSWGLMERLGMARRADLDFRHPRFDSDNDLFGRMIVYALDRPETTR